jgi:photosystem II stability/assembly factor-like uncharacterized protein
MLRTKFMRAVLCLVLLMFMHLPSVSWAENKLLEQPADISHKAKRSVMLGLAHAGSNLVTVGERGFILLSEDDGYTWQQVPVPTSVTLTAVYFVSPEKGWVVGHGGVVLRTTNGGKSWSRVLDGKTAAAIEFTAAEAAYSPDNRRSAFRLRDAKSSVDAGADKPFLNLHFTDDNNGIVVGAYGMAFVTHDGGNSWESLMGQIPNTMGMHLYDVHVQDGTTFLIGEQGSLFRSTEEGAPFIRIETPYEGSFFGMIASQYSDLLLYGLRGHLFRSTDNGNNWQQVSLPLPVTLTSGSRLEDGRLVLVDETGQVFLSRDNGEHFDSVAIDNPSAFTNVIEAANGDLVLSGVRGISRVVIKNLNEKVSGDE